MQDAEDATSKGAAKQSDAKRYDAIIMVPGSPVSTSFTACVTGSA